MNTVITMENLVKKYGDKTIIPDINLEIKGGEFFTLLGPSGCGKTTLLRMIAGFNSIEGGQIFFNDSCINNIPPYKRNIGMVFQNYAIFPHMSVSKNVEYGLKQRKISKEETKRRVEEIMEIVKITEHTDKSPNQLSGGQQQRVALARAIVIHPKVLLMDEPLSNLDAKLRVEMRSAIREIQKDVDITTVYVTHDQEEALAVSDRIAVMNLGELQQVGTPEVLYKRPANIFVATFVGTSNVLGGICETIENEWVTIKIREGVYIKMNNIQPGIEKDTPVKISIRPEEFNFSKDETGLKGTVLSRTFLGRNTDYEIKLRDGIVLEVSHESGIEERSYEKGDTVYLTIDSKRINVFDAFTEKSMIKED